MPSTYTTVQGDAWDIISLKVYGTEKSMSTLIEANPAHRNTVIFAAGVLLTVPTRSVSSIPGSVPPWKRGVE
ncbi:MAG: tail protein X [Sporomusaceae bacterium]|nr:tail protein X [Sporomusaceae bacterium]